jgi:hypothetical protein
MTKEEQRHDELTDAWRAGWIRRCVKDVVSPDAEAIDPETRRKFLAIDWESFDVGVVCRFYGASGCRFEEQALLLGLIGMTIPDQWRDEWMRQCVADAALFRDVACPGCAA